MVHENNPDAACMDEIERTERKSGVQANPSCITPAKLLCAWLQWLYTFAGRAQFDFFVRFWKRSEPYKMIDDMLARANPVCLLALSRSDRRTFALLLVRVDSAVLCCALLCLRYGRSADS